MKNRQPPRKIIARTTDSGVQIVITGFAGRRSWRSGSSGNMDWWKYRRRTSSFINLIRSPITGGTQANKKGWFTMGMRHFLNIFPAGFVWLMIKKRAVIMFTDIDKI